MEKIKLNTNFESFDIAIRESETSKDGNSWKWIAIINFQNGSNFKIENPTTYRHISYALLESFGLIESLSFDINNSFDFKVYYLDENGTYYFNENMNDVFRADLCRFDDGEITKRKENI